VKTEIADAVGSDVKEGLFTIFCVVVLIGFNAMNPGISMQ